MEHPEACPRCKRADESMRVIEAALLDLLTRVQLLEADGEQRSFAKTAGEAIAWINAQRAPSHSPTRG